MRCSYGKNASGFTAIELIFVIVLISVLASISFNMFYKDSDNLRLAADQLIRHIKYTKHLALNNDVYDPNDSFYKSKNGNDNKGQWHKAMWKIAFADSKGDWYYNIYSDRDRGGSVSKDELALDPATREPLGETNNAQDKSRLITNITSRFNVVVDDNSDSTTCKDNGNKPAIAFDYLGRPYKDIQSIDNSEKIYEKLYDFGTTCKIVLKDKFGTKANIIVQALTGYVSLEMPDKN